MDDHREGVEDGRQKDDRLQAVVVVARPEGVAYMVDRRLPVGVRLEDVGYMDGRQMVDGRRQDDRQRDVVGDRRMADPRPVVVVDRRMDDPQQDVVGGHPSGGRQRVVGGGPRTGGLRQGEELMRLRFAVADLLGLVGNLRVGIHQDGFFRRCRSLLLGMYHHWLHTMADAACRSKIVAFAILRVGGC